MKAAKYVARQESLTEFLQTNEKSFERMAIYILGRWKAPNDVSVADVVQELRIAAWRCARKFDPKYGKTPEQYVAWNTINAAKKYVHRQRRGRDDWASSRFDVLMDYGINHDAMKNTPTIDAPQEVELQRREQLRVLLDRCTSASTAICLVVFFEAESTEGAARSILENENLRRVCGVETMKDAARMVRKAVKEQSCQQG